MPRPTDYADAPNLVQTAFHNAMIAGILYKVATIHGACDGEDANNNPTPDTVAFPPADFPPGSLFIPTSYLATLASGDTVDSAKMVFRREGGSGSEAWVWTSGSYRASDSNGEYQRDADGSQKCRGVDARTAQALTTAQGNVFSSGTITVTWPATFAAAPVMAFQVAGHAHIMVGSSSFGSTTTQGNTSLISPTSQTVDLDLHFLAEGRWA